MRKIALALALTSMGTGAWAQERLTLWQNIEAGMTTAEMQALYPEIETRDEDGKKRQVEHHRRNTELHGYLKIGKCRPRVEVLHPDGVVTGVYIWMRPEGILKAMCAEEARAAVLTRFGTPITRHEDEDEGLYVDSTEEVLTWIKDGMTITFYHEDIYDAWHIEYETVGSADAAGL